MEFWWLSRWVRQIREFVRLRIRRITIIGQKTKIELAKTSNRRQGLTRFFDQHCAKLLSRPCQVLGFKTVALIADRLSFSLHHYSMHAGKTGGYIPTHGLEILAYWVVPAIYGFFVVSHDVLHWQLQSLSCQLISWLPNCCKHGAKAQKMRSQWPRIFLV